MANTDTFQAGVDAGMGRKKKSSNDDSDPNKSLRKAGFAGAASAAEAIKGVVPKAKRGGKVKKGGLVDVHKGEIIVTAAKAKRMEKKRREKKPRKQIGKR